MSETACTDPSIYCAPRLVSVNGVPMVKKPIAATGDKMVKLVVPNDSPTKVDARAITTLTLGP